MPKFVIRGADKPEEIVEFWLESGGYGGVELWARSGRAVRMVARVVPDGKLYRCGGSTGVPGLQYDDKGRIKEVE